MSIADVQPGDLVVRPGEKILVEGEVVEESSSIDEAMMSRESVTVQKQVGGAVMSAIK